MFRSLAFMFLGIAVLSFTAPWIAVEQTSAQDASQRRGAQQRIEKEDVFSRLAPLAEAAQPAREEPPQNNDAEPPVVEDDVDVHPGNTPVLKEAPPADASATTPEANENEEAASARGRTRAREELSPRVRALVDSSRSSGRRRRAAQGQLAQHGELTRLSEEELRQLVAHAAALLARDLEGVHFGARWQKHLRLSQLAQHFLMKTEPGDGATAPQAPPKAGLQTIVHGYDKLADDPRYERITKRPSFQLLHQGLTEYLATSDDRERRRAAYEDVVALQQALEPVPTGHQWREYFALDRLGMLLASPRPLSKEDRGQLQLVVARFEKATVEPQFKAVAALPGFSETYKRLQSAVAVIPDAEIEPITGERPAPQLSGRPVPQGEAPPMYLLAETGLTFQRDKQAEGWEVVRDSATLATGNRIKTNDQGSARLVIGSNVQILCGANSLLQITQYLDDQGRHVTQLASHGGNLKVRASGREETDAREDRAEAAAPRRFGDRIEIVYEDRHIIADAQKLELDFQHDREGNRVIAAVYAGGVQVKHDRTGDEVAIGAGREAVMLPAGIAVRPAAAKPDSWWPARRSQTATGTGGGFSR